ncbi:formate dehydrogenase accessory protein FdhE [Achromobacter xylosoxidans]|uniref:formate dehydrogenase accessory protein FdhE n=1 Tax=Alcaligenes xylosoxydans xylosoxydans TaxID=85698 RepID=UPI000479132A|nr:formate dehydrogenase accessory protein FdhE [Achromobacter xylosoxidans]MBK1977572.1 formate dehydrogenase accessory protein FdhE [Achromobacter xylosoxidans]MCH4594368.1 formate dehydrogenase accessory protein FdhE [Achromobacter xylosoxidans]MCM2575278.1 formate dehydrogenase accessory protein FdhE [Achromobacter xylosoxidans]PNM91226.1 formate dehydrogenase accessory protein FdhE [Achromobacter xylosoxidans]
MQRILPRGEIEALDHNTIPRIQLPARDSVFATRAARLRQLAVDSPVADYLLLMARLVDAQQNALRGCNAPPASEDRIALAQAHGMPPLQAVGWPRDPLWRDILRQLVDEVAGGQDVPAEALEVCSALRRALDEDTESLEDLAEAVLSEQHRGVDGAAAPFVMAALQVYWTDLASRFDEKQLPVASPFGVCPVCASLPVASVVRVGGQFEGYRYLCCSLCATQWHMVRVKCSHCEDVESVAYQAIEGRAPAIKAETCDRCHTYRKIFYQDKDLQVEPVADDLASLMLDVLVGEAGYSRASGNPLLWHGAEEE